MPCPMPVRDPRLEGRQENPPFSVPWRLPFLFVAMRAACLLGARRHSLRRFWRCQRLGVGQIHLHGEADRLLDAVAGIDRAVAQKAHHAMGMHYRLAVAVTGDTSKEGGDFHLLVQLYDLESLFRSVGPADHRRPEGTNRLEMGIGQVVLLREIDEPGCNVVTL